MVVKLNTVKFGQYFELWSKLWKFADQTNYENYGQNGLPVIGASYSQDRCWSKYVHRWGIGRGWPAVALRGREVEKARPQITIDIEGIINMNLIFLPLKKSAKIAENAQPYLLAGGGPLKAGREGAP